MARGMETMVCRCLFLCALSLSLSARTHMSHVRMCADEVVSWVTTVAHGAFAKYEARLLHTLRAMNYKGEYLSEVNVEEWRMFGVVSVTDAKLLQRATEKLIAHYRL